MATDPQDEPLVLPEFDASVELPDQRDSNDLADLESLNFDKEQKTLELKLLNEQIDGINQDRTERKSYALKLYWLLVGWLIFVAACFLLSGHEYNARIAPVSDSITIDVESVDAKPVAVAGQVSSHKFNLSDTVLIALLSGATINIIALFTVVALYLFPSDRKPKGLSSPTE